MYTSVGNADFRKIVEKFQNNKTTKKEKLGIIFDTLKKCLFQNKTKRFCIPGIDSYFNQNFIPDCDDLALKSTKPVRVYNNRFSAMVAGLKKFGLKGMKENKSRVAVGIGMLALGVGAGLALLKKGINNIKQDNKYNLSVSLRYFINLRRRDSNRDL